MTANQGEAVISIPIHGAGKKEIMATGRSKIEEQRTLVQNGETFWDDASCTYLRLDQILVPYLPAVEPVIKQFATLLG
jgi:hypothetical protein